MTLICSILSRAIHQMRCSLLVRSAESFCLNFFLPFLIKVPYRCRQLERHSCGLVNPWWSSWVLPSCERECAFHLKKFVVARQRMLSVLQRIETHKMSCIKCHKKPEPYVTFGLIFPNSTATRNSWCSACLPFTWIHIVITFKDFMNTLLI